MRRTGEFAAVRQRGVAKSGRLLTLAFLDDPAMEEVKFGFTVSKRIGNAVVRNKTKRRLREIARLNRPLLSGAGLLVSVPRPAAVTASFDGLLGEWRYLAKKLGLMSGKEQTGEKSAPQFGLDK